MRTVVYSLSITSAKVSGRDVLNRTPVNKVATGSIRNISPSRFMAASRKKSFHISVMSHNAEVKLCNLYQFTEAFNGIANCKIFHRSFMFHHFTINCIWLMLFMHELKQVLVLVKEFSFINRNEFSLTDTSTFSCSVLCMWRNLVKAFTFSK